MILKTHFAFNIVFIQEPFWLTICSILSLKNRDGKELVGVLNYPNWLTFANTSSVKIARSGLSFSYSLFLFSFLFDLLHCISIFRTRVRVRVTRSHCYITDHKLHDEQKNIEGSGRDDVISCTIYMVI